MSDVRYYSVRQICCALIYARVDFVDRRQRSHVSRYHYNCKSVKMNVCLLFTYVTRYILLCTDRHGHSFQSLIALTDHKNCA